MTQTETDHLFFKRQTEMKKKIKANAVCRQRSFSYRKYKQNKAITYILLLLQEETWASLLISFQALEVTIIGRIRQISLAVSSVIKDQVVHWWVLLKIRSENTKLSIPLRWLQKRRTNYLQVAFKRVFTFILEK
jgi:hypothetical protein